MSRKNATAAAESKLSEIPSPEANPAVAAARERHDKLKEKLAAITEHRARLESEVGAKAGDSYDDLEAKLLARGRETDALAKLRELRRAEKVTAQAAALVAAEVKAAREAATRELTAVVREEVFLPAVQGAIKDWLDAVKKVEKFRQLVDHIQHQGVGSNTFSPFNGRVPLSLADPDGFAAFVGELISDGFTDKATIKAALPDLDL